MVTACSVQLRRLDVPGEVDLRGMVPGTGTGTGPMAGWWDGLVGLEVVCSGRPW